MAYTKQEKLNRLNNNLKIYKIVIKECKLKLSMHEMTYPGSVQTFFNGKPNYSKTINDLREVIKNITKLKKELK